MYFIIFTFNNCPSRVDSCQTSVNNTATLWSPGENLPLHVEYTVNGYRIWWKSHVCIPLWKTARNPSQQSYASMVRGLLEAKALSWGFLQNNVHSRRFKDRAESSSWILRFQRLIHFFSPSHFPSLHLLSYSSHAGRVLE